MAIALRSFLVLVICHFAEKSDEAARLPSPTQLATELGRLATEGMGTAKMQNHFNSLPFTKIQLKGKDIIKDLTTRIANKIKGKVKMALKMKELVEASYASPQVVRSRQECCNMDTSKLTYESKFRTKVDMEDVCVMVSGSAPPNAIHLQDSVLKAMIENNKRYPTLQWQYFGSEQGVYTNYPALKTKGACSSYDPRVRPWYVETASPLPKDLVLVLDYSGSMNDGNRLIIAQKAAEAVLDTLNPRDRVAVIAFDDKILTWSKWKDKCFVSNLADASPVNIKILKDFINGVIGGGYTHYIKAFNAAFDILDVYYKGENTSSRQPLILFMTDGAPNDPEGRDALLSIVKDRNKALTIKASILTFGMGSDIGKGEGILRELADQTKKEGSAGKYSPVPNTRNLRNKMATYYESIALQGDTDHVTLSIPYIDLLGLGLMTSITVPCFHGGKFIGVVGSDLLISDLLSDVTYFSQGQGSYAFVSDSSGRTMLHPLLPRPSEPYQAPFFVDIVDLEPADNFTNIVFQGIKSGTPGNLKMTSPRFLSRGGNLYEGVTRKDIPSIYFWGPVHGTNLTIGVVLQEDGHYFATSALQRPPGFTFLYHRLDLNRPDSSCKFFGQLTAKSRSVIQFAPQAFKDPFFHLATKETNETVKGYANYFEGRTNVNPKLKDNIINSVYATYKAENIWLNSKASLSQYVVWKYIGVRDGVFRMFPGAALPKNFDATGRPWYQAAVSSIGKIAISAPYVDAAGAGLIITAAQTIFKSKGDNIHTTPDDVMAVMGADFTLTYFKKMLTDTYPHCKSAQYSCFVMDRGGFLIYHDSFMTPQIKKTDLNLAHVTEKEKGVSSDMIDRGILLGMQCRDTATIKTVNYFDVRVESGGVHHSASILGCTFSYNIHPIRGTTAFLGIVERTGACSRDSVCYCHSDKTAKLCSDPKHTCECPCRSELDFSYCDNEFPPSNGSICSFHAQSLLSSAQETPCLDEDLQLCFDPKCDEKTTEDKCEGVVGCSWCIKNRNDIFLSKPYCSEVSRCFGGKEGTPFPGSSEKNVCPSKQENESSSESSSGSSTGKTVAIVVVPCVILIIIVIIAYVVVRKKIKKKRRAAANVNANPHPSAQVNASYKPSEYASYQPPPPEAPPLYTLHIGGPTGETALPPSYHF